jgi:hypothetical protein
MHELVYVLTVEAFVFGLVAVLLVAQRWDVWESRADRAWPVFSSCVVLILGYAQVLLVLCCFIAVGRFGVLAHGMMDACARSAGRLSTVALLSVCYVAALLLISNSTEQGSVQCFLAQLCGTSCAPARPVLWSYSVYLAVLLPVGALVAALQVTAAGMCKDLQRTSRTRLLCINCVYLLTYNVNYTLRMNVRCKQACDGAAVTDKATLIVCTEVLYFVGALCASDILAETVMMRHTLSIRFLRRPLPQMVNRIFPPFPRLPSVAVFSLLRLCQLLSVVFFNWRAATPLPWQLLVAHISLASILCLLDILEVVVQYASAVNTRDRNTRDLPAQQIVLKQDTDAGVQHVPTALRTNKAFEVDSGSRRKFMMTFTGRSRWPSMLNAPTVKKMT